MLRQGKLTYLLVIALLAAPVLAFRPAMWLVHKPANRENPNYVSGWEDGCISGANSYSLLYAPLLEQPFIKALDAETDAPAKTKDLYKNGWNEGFTMCRFYQSSVYELMQFTIIIATLLFIGYLLIRRKS